MSTISPAGLSPYDVIAFIQEHTQVYASMIKDEMNAAQDRTALVKDIADLQAGLESCKGGDWARANKLVWDFQTKHPETWGGGPQDMCELAMQTKSWVEGYAMAPNSYKQENYANATDPGSSFHATWSRNGDVKVGDAAAVLDEGIKKLDSWKDSINSDDKIGLMTLQEHAEDLKNLYEVGSNLNAKTDQVASLIISNMGKG